MNGYTKKSIKRDDRIIIHFDYDSFYCSVVERANPVLKSVPLGIQQKNIIVTCNAEARRRGLFKLQRLSEAKKACPDLVLVSGEDLTRFRDASKELYGFFQEAVWTERSERLGLDEVYLDVSGIIQLNMGLFDGNDLRHSFFRLSRTDPSQGFSFDANQLAGSIFPRDARLPSALSPDAWPCHEEWVLHRRLLLGSHLAQYLRRKLEDDYGFTSSVGIATSKLLSKIVGRRNKPRGQTTLVPPYETQSPNEVSNVIRLMDMHGVGQIPGIGWKLGQKLRAYMLERPTTSWEDHFYSSSKTDLAVKSARCFPGVSPQLLEGVCAGPGFQVGIGAKVYNLLHGIDHAEVAVARKVPRQISIEDSYPSLQGLERARAELYKIAQSLLRRLRIDLLRPSDDTGVDGSDPNAMDRAGRNSWMAYPRTLRLSTRPKRAVNADGTMTSRVSRSTRMPSLILNVSEDTAVLARRLVDEAVLPLFCDLHPPGSAWNLSLLNIAATDLVETAKEDERDVGHNMSIGYMFKKQEVSMRRRYTAISDGSNERLLLEMGRDSNVQDMAGHDSTVQGMAGPRLEVSDLSKGYGLQGSEDLLGPRLGISSEDEVEDA